MAKVFGGRAAGTAVALAVLLLAACGDDTGADASDGAATTAVDAPTTQPAPTTSAATPSDDERQAYIDAVRSNADPSVEPDDAQCVAESLVDGFGVDELVATGVTADDIAGSRASLLESGIVFSDAQRSDALERLQACMDVRAFLGASLAGGRPGPLADCIADNLDEDLIERALVPGLTTGGAALQEDEALLADLEAAVAPCR